MRRSDGERLEDIRQAIDLIGAHLATGPLTDGIVFDAVRMRLLIIGEAANALPRGLRETEPETPWGDIIGLRNIIAHRYFDTAFSIVQSTVDTELVPLADAVERMRHRLGDVPAD